jgi:hypothetical protein
MKKELTSMEIEPVENGGHIVTHRYKSQPKVGRGGDLSTQYVEPEKFTFGKSEGPKLHAHIAEHLGVSRED